jgi:hypothetical protein
MLYCKTRNKPVRSEDCCIVGYNALIIDCMIVMVYRNRTVFGMNERQSFLDVPCHILFIFCHKCERIEHIKDQENENNLEV